MGSPENIPKGSKTEAGGKRSATTGKMLEGKSILKGSENYVWLALARFFDPFRINWLHAKLPVVALRLPPAIVCRSLRDEAQRCRKGVRPVGCLLYDSLQSNKAWQRATVPDAFLVIIERQYLHLIESKRGTNHAKS